MIRRRQTRPWSPRPQVAPKTRVERSGDLRIDSNGSPGCFGGWELVYPATGHGRRWMRFRVKAHWADLKRGYDSVNTAVAWLDKDGTQVDWDPIFPARVERRHVVYERLLRVPGEAHTLVVKLLIAWSETGSLWFADPQLETVRAPSPRHMRLGAAGCPLPPGPHTLQSNMEFFLRLARQAARHKLDLLCLPEVILSWGLPRAEGEGLYRQAVTIPGEELRAFCKLARETRMALCFSVLERSGELLHNTAVLIDKQGKLAGKYRKVHLAQPGEVWMGITPGHELPVFPIEDTQVGMNICMDSSAAESARVPARCGAEIILLPIMGDHRADSWVRGRLNFDVEKWMMIHKMRAMDNQVHMVVARNNGYGTGIFSPRGEMLAMGGENRSIVWADVDLNDAPQTWTGASFKAVCWYERREPAYGQLCGGCFPNPFGRARASSQQITYFPTNVTEHYSR